MPDRRGTYFAFQGLLMAVLLLMFLYQYPRMEGWLPRFYFLIVSLGSSLVFLRTVPARIFTLWWFQAGLFVGDAFLASIILRWTHPFSELYLIYFLIIFGTALTRSFTQSFAVAVVTSFLYMLSGWHAQAGFPADTGFWLRVNFLWVSAALLAILSRDSHQLQKEQEQKYQERLIQLGRMATLGQVAGEVAHRIKAPLTTIQVNAEVLERRPETTKEAAKELDQIIEEVGRCKDILKNLLDLGRIEEMDFTPMDLRDPIRSVLESVKPQLKKHGISLLSAGLDRPLRMRGDPSLLHEAVSAVLQNAIDAVKKNGTIRVEVQRQDMPWWSRWPGKKREASFVVSIEDDGSGIRAADIERVFEPFFTTKGKQGSGLGLSAALRILQKHGGSIEADSEGLGKGARFSLILPAAGAERTA